MSVTNASRPDMSEGLTLGHVANGRGVRAGSVTNDPQGAAASIA
jgi:hypothetical protein